MVKRASSVHDSQCRMCMKRRFTKASRVLFREVFEMYIVGRLAESAGKRKRGPQEGEVRPIIVGSSQILPLLKDRAGLYDLIFCQVRLIYCKGEALPLLAR